MVTEEFEDVISLNSEEFHMEYDYLIVGSGLSGSVLAFEATKRGKKCLVIEKRRHVGGNVYCENIEGINVHTYGAHIFHTGNPVVWAYVKQFSSFNNFINSPIANYKGEIYNLPFNMNTFSKMWGVSSPREAQAIIEKQRGEIRAEPRNLEEQAIRLVGRDIFEKLIKGYTEKQWGRPCSELPACIIKRLPVRFTYNNNYFDDPYQGIPIEGYNAIVEKLLADVDVETDTDFLAIRDVYSKKAKQIIYTGMIDAYFDYKYGQLEYRSLRMESRVLNEENLQGVAVVNYTDKETPYTRVIEHKHFEFGNGPKTVITYEYPANYERGAEAFYPVNDEKNQKLYARYQALSEREKSTFFIGRLAEYKYHDMDDVIANALLFAENVMS
jgi:UDP-galactopyranose mutase